MKMFLFIGFVLQLLTLPTLCTFAWFRGGMTERRVATALMIAVLATIAAPLVGSKFQGPNWGVIVVDVALMIAVPGCMCGITSRDRRNGARSSTSMK